MAEGGSPTCTSSTRLTSRRDTTGVTSGCSSFDFADAGEFLITGFAALQCSHRPVYFAAAKLRVAPCACAVHDVVVLTMAFRWSKSYNVDAVALLEL